jgi:hypothetical protein
LTFISIVPYNRELLVNKDMEVFTSFFCYAKRQKKGVVPSGRPALANEEYDGSSTLLDPIEESEDADLLPVTNLGFRR